MYRRGISSLHPAFYYFLLHLLPSNIPGVCDNHILSYSPSSFVTPVFIFLCPAYLIGTAYTSTLLLCPICHEWNMWFLIGPYLAFSLRGVGRICSVLCRRFLWFLYRRGYSDGKGTWKPWIRLWENPVRNDGWDWGLTDAPNIGYYANL